MVSDSEPRYRLVDSNDNVVGALYAQGDGTLAIQEGTSGSDNEVTVDTDGTFNAPAVSTDGLNLTPVLDNVTTYPSGVTAEIVIPNATTADNIIATAVPANDPGNDHGYSVDKIYFDTSANEVKLVVSETEGDGGGDARRLAWKLDG